MDVTAGAVMGHAPQPAVNRDIIYLAVHAIRTVHTIAVGVIIHTPPVGLAVLQTAQARKAHIIIVILINRDPVHHIMPGTARTAGPHVIYQLATQIIIPATVRHAHRSVTDIIHPAVLLRAVHARTSRRRHLIPAVAVAKTDALGHYPAHKVVLSPTAQVRKHTPKPVSVPTPAVTILHLPGRVTWSVVIPGTESRATVAYSTQSRPVIT